MPSPILDALPSIHSTLVGLGAGFYSAYAVFALQKIIEARDKVTASFNFIKGASVPQVYLGGSAQNPPEISTYQIAARFNQLLGSLRSSVLNADEYSDQAKYEITVGLCKAFQDLLTNYPFFATSAVQYNDIKPKEVQIDELDSKRIYEIGALLRNIIVDVRSFPDEFRAFFAESQRIEIQISRENIKKMYRERAEKDAKLPVSHQSMREKWAKEDEKRLAEALARVQPSLALHLESYFRLCDNFLNEWHPGLDTAFKNWDLSTKFFRLKTHSFIAFSFAIFILSIGVAFPPLFQTFRAENGISSSRAWDVGVLIITLAPYFVAIFWMFRKLKNWNYLGLGKD